MRRRSSLVVAILLSGVVTATAQTPSATFIRGLNLNGPPLEIDGHAWDGRDANWYECRGNAFENQSVTLRPATTAARSQMIRSSRWGRDLQVLLKDLPAADYQLGLYVWEDNDSTTFSVTVNDRRMVERHVSGPGGTWRRLGPWRVRPVQGQITIAARGGDANLSGIEIWSGTGKIPEPLESSFNNSPSDDELAFFESRIRPLLVRHCYECHSQQASEPGGNLLLDSRPGIVRGGDSGQTLIPGEPDVSRLILAVRQRDPDFSMPPDGKLTDLEIADLERWVRQRAPDPRTTDTVALRQQQTDMDLARARDFWSLKSVAATPPPAVTRTDWPANELDSWILARLEENHLSPATDADRAALLRRVTYDLIGLPPSPEELNDFLNDTSPTAYERTVDRLLHSPQYGERWGRHWLDVVRYSDTAGDNSDFPIPQMYRYRNWVLDAFNRDLPYDTFVREQLAGDLLDGPAETANERIIATGYLANARRFGSRVDDYPQHLTIEDTLDNLGRTFLATTINCARCHNHKFDPITVDDYYGLYGIFHSTRYPWPGIELDQQQRHLVPLVETKTAEKLSVGHTQQQRQLDAAIRDLESRLKSAPEASRKELRSELERARRQALVHSRRRPFEEAYAVADASVIENAAIQIKGDPARPGAVVPRRFPAVLGGFSLSDDDRTSGRIQLADWIVAPANPLTARVMVNRIWLGHFGRGLVTTPNDFGRQGRAPSHPELLDHLAQRFRDGGWSMKRMHREMVLSHTYRQSSHRSVAAQQHDPTGELLAAFPRRRLDAEALRDTLLLLGGELDDAPGGPHPFPDPADWKFTQHNPFKAIYESRRRSVYLMTQRIQRHPYLAIFDGPDPAASTPQRGTSTTPLQALYLLNDAFVHEQAAGLATRLTTRFHDPRDRILHAMRMILGRPAGNDDLDRAEAFLEAARQALADEGIPADQQHGLAWQAWIRALFRLNEFVYID